MFRQRHPPGLAVLFFTEMWERFSFYTMAAVFMLYMKDQSHAYPFLRDNASLINGLYVGTVYFTPFFGGMLADRKIGYRWAIIWGALWMGLGQFLLAVDSLTFFFAGLVALVVGNGLFKPNISTLVGKLYEPNDPRLDSAYLIFYMGINLGALIAPFVAQYVRNRYGFHAAFASAGFGMGISLVVFLACQRWLVFTDYRQAQAQPVGELVAPKVQRRRNTALLIIFVLVALFWMAFKQNTNTFPLWARDCTDRTPPAFLADSQAVLDKEGKLSTELNACINPFFVIVFSPLMVLFWHWLRGRGLEPSTPAKIGIGMALAAAAFGILALGGLAGGDMGAIRQNPRLAQVGLAAGVVDPAGGLTVFAWWQGLLASDVGRVSMWYLIGGYAVITLAELCLSPIGLSLVSKLADPRHRSAWMGGWFVATAVGGYLSGIVGIWWERMPHSQFFGLLAGTSVLAGALLVIFLPRLRAAMPSAAPAKLPHHDDDGDKTIVEVSDQTAIVTSPPRAAQTQSEKPR
jgi:POT family proton-dependent oligopeptide transporter